MAGREGGALVVAGEALVDIVLDRREDLRAHPGGGPYNLARTLGRLEQPVLYLGRVSTDRFGTRLRAELLRDGVGLDAVVATDQPTTLALAEIGADGSATYRFYVEGTSSPGLTLPEAIRVLPADVAVLVVGTLGLVYEPAAATHEELVARAGPDTLVMLDPNCRPATIADGAAFRGRIGRMLRRTDLLKASVEDLEYLRPGTDAVDAVRGMLAEGPAAAVITRGGDGATVVTRDEAVDVPPVPVEVVDTIGAGDSFGGGFLAWWRREGLGRAELAQLDLVLEATRFAALVAARTCGQAGAVPPRLAELGL